MSTDLQGLPPELVSLAEADPQAARKLLEELVGKSITPHPAQQKVIDSNARFRVMNCGRRWGKTTLAARLAISKARKKGQMIWWVAPVYSTTKRGYKEVLRQLPKGVLAKPAPPDTNFDAGRKVILHFKNGSVMEFYSAERPDGMLGEGVDFAVLDEAALMPSTIWQQIVRPTLMDRQGGALMISTPRGKNWFYKVWVRGQSDDKDDHNWESWTFPSESNIYLKADEIEDMKRDLPSVLFEQEVLGKFIAAGSNVFTIPDHIIRNGPVKPDGHVVLGIDLAKSTDYTVIYGANAKTRETCYFDRFQDVTWPRQRRRIIKVVKKLMKEGATGVTLAVDSTGVGDPMVDELEELGFDVVGLNFTTYKTKMVNLLARDLEDGRAFILEEGSDEFEAYAMNFSPTGKITFSAPAGDHDDVVSAKMLQHWVLVNEGVPDATIIDGIDYDSIPSDPHPDDDVMPDEEDDDDFAWMYEERDTGQPEVQTVRARSTQDLMNDPSVWGY